MSRFFITFLMACSAFLVGAVRDAGSESSYFSRMATRRLGASVSCEAAEGLQAKYTLERMKQVKIEEFTLHSCLGGGASGEAWIASSGDETVAVKLIKTVQGGGEFELEKMQRECEVTKFAHGLDSAHTVNCRELGTVNIGSDELPYAVYDLARGIELGKVLSGAIETPPVQLPSLQAVIGATIAIFEVMEKLGSNADSPVRIYHRDLQTANAMIDTTGRVMAIDFGEAVMCCLSKNQGEEGMCEEASAKFQLPVLKCMQEVQGRPLIALFREENLMWLILDFVMMLINPVAGKNEYQTLPEAIRDVCLRSEWPKIHPAKASLGVQAAMREAYQSDWEQSDGKEVILAGLTALVASDSTWPPRFIVELKRAYETLASSV